MTASVHLCGVRRPRWLPGGCLALEHFLPLTDVSGLREGGRWSPAAGAVLAATQASPRSPARSGTCGSLLAEVEMRPRGSKSFAGGHSRFLAALNLLPDLSGSRRPHLIRVRLGLFPLEPRSCLFFHGGGPACSEWQSAESCRPSRSPLCAGGQVTSLEPLSPYTS